MGRKKAIDEAEEREQKPIEMQEESSSSVDEKLERLIFRLGALIQAKDASDAEIKEKKQLIIEAWEEIFGLDLDKNAIRAFLQNQREGKSEAEVKIGLLKFTRNKLRVKLKEGRKELRIACAERDEMEAALNGMGALLLKFKKTENLLMGVSDSLKAEAVAVEARNQRFLSETEDSKKKKRHEFEKSKITHPKANKTTCLEKEEAVDNDEEEEQRQDRIPCVLSLIACLPISLLLLASTRFKH